MARLHAFIDPSAKGEGARQLVAPALQTLWNLANTPDGKAASIQAGLLTTLALQMKQGLPNVRRLAAGCVMAITIDKDGKLSSLICVEPLCEVRRAAPLAARRRKRKRHCAAVVPFRHT